MRTTARFVAAFGVSALVAAGGVHTSGVAGGPGTATGDGLTRAQADEAVRAHNTWRQRVGVPPIAWATDLAARAQDRAAYLAGHGCEMEHGPLPKDIGENLGWVGSLRSAGHKDELDPVRPRSWSIRGVQSQPTTLPSVTRASRIASATTTPRSCGPPRPRSAAEWRCVRRSTRCGSATTARRGISGAAGSRLARVDRRAPERGKASRCQTARPPPQSVQNGAGTRRALT